MRVGFGMRTILLSVALVGLVAAGSLAEAFTFVHISDTHITGAGAHKENLANIAAEVNAIASKPVFVLASGDLTETGRPGDLEQYREFIKAFQMPVYNVMGNHETKWSNWGNTSNKRMFNQDNRYSFTHGGIHFVAMDSSMWMQHHGLLDRSQLTWLKHDLDKAGRQMPAVLFYHHCPGFIPNEAELLRTLRPYNVRLILVGHGHNFNTWKRNGLLFQEVKGAMNDPGGYRILEVAENEIRSYTKVVGKDRVLDATIPLMSASNPVTLLTPRAGNRIEGEVRIRAAVQAGENRTVEYAIDGDFQPLPIGSLGIYEIAAKFEGTPGWHTITVRATDPDGMEWQDTAPVRINAQQREAWHINTLGGVQRAVQAFGDRLYFGTLGGDVYCLEARTGRQVWRHGAGSDIVCEVATDGKMVYFGTADGRILSLDAFTGEQRWEYKTDGPVQGSPMIGDGKVFIGSGESAYYALDAQTGKLLWKTPMERMTQVHPILMGDTIYFGAWDKYFYALNTHDGSIRWKTLIGINFFYSTANSDPVTDGKRIVANVTPYKPEDPDIYCLDAANGDILWKLHNSGKSDCGFNSPSIVGDRLYCVAGGGDLFCLQMADGKKIWRSSIGISVLTGKPVPADGKLYIPGLRGTVVCADAADGKKLWSYSTGGGYLFGFATVWQDLVIVPSVDGSVTALHR